MAPRLIVFVHRSSSATRYGHRWLVVRPRNRCCCLEDLAESTVEAGKAGGVAPARVGLEAALISVPRRPVWKVARLDHLELGPLI